MSCGKKLFAAFPEECPYQEINKNCTEKECAHHTISDHDIINIIKPKVSIIMPFYYSRSPGIRYIQRAIKSVIKQTYQNWELIIIDDGSPNYDPIRDLMKNVFDKRIVWLRLTSNHGQSEARNIGFIRSTGDVISYLDYDDYYLPNHLITCLKTMIGSNSDFIFGNFYYDTEKYSAGKLMFKKYTKDQVQSLTLDIKHSNPIAINSVMHTVDIFFRAGGFEEGVICGEDGLLWRRMLEAGAKYVCSKEPTSVYFKHVNESLHQHISLKSPEAIPGVHLCKGKNGQELDVQEKFIERKKRLKTRMPTPKLVY